MRKPETPVVGELMRLDGRRALVTGASGNIGRAIAARLAEAGAAVALHWHENEAAAAELARELGGAMTVQADLAREDEVRKLIDASRPDLLVNNAAIQPVRPLAGMSIEEWRATHAVNLDAAFLVTRLAASAWRDSASPGAIVNIASIEGMDPAEGHAHYASSKAALLMLTRASAAEYGGQGIRVNAVSPGLVDRDGLAGDWPEGVSRWLDRVPLGRLGTANDVADAVLFLLGPGARFISGANLVVDGGMSARSRW